MGKINATFVEELTVPMTRGNYVYMETENSEIPWTNGWESTKNLSDLQIGSFRSILGYAGESLVIGRALVCGYNLFFKAWRDSKYDAVLDSKGVLFRIEIKQTGDGTSISATSGSRSGAQISREADDRTEVLSPEDSDFLIGVHSLTGRCWIIPTEVVFIRNRNSLPTNQLTDFEEKWRIFHEPPFGLSMEQIKVGFRKLDIDSLKQIAKQVGVAIEEASISYQFTSRNRAVDLQKIEHWYVLEIWKKIFNAI
jgi:hypothetical protein